MLNYSRYLRQTISGYTRNYLCLFLIHSTPAEQTRAFFVPQKRDTDKRLCNIAYSVMSFDSKKVTEYCRWRKGALNRSPSVTTNVPIMGGVLIVSTGIWYITHVLSYSLLK